MARSPRPGPVDASRGSTYPPREFAQLPVPPPDLVHAARARLAGRFSIGVDALLWETTRQPLQDAQAISAVVSGAEGKDEPAPGALDFGAALIVLAALRLDIDRLEADLVKIIRDAGLDWEFIATTLHMPVQQAAKRQRLIRKRRDLLTDRVLSPVPAHDRPSPDGHHSADQPHGRQPHDGQPRNSRRDIPRQATR